MSRGAAYLVDVGGKESLNGEFTVHPLWQL